MENKQVQGIPNNQVNPVPQAPSVSQEPAANPMTNSVKEVMPAPLTTNLPVPKPAPKKDEKLDLSMIKSSTWMLAGGAIIGMALGGLISLITGDNAFLGYGFAVGLFLGYGIGYWRERNAK